MARACDYETDALPTALPRQVTAEECWSLGLNYLVGAHGRDIV